ncbi:ABC transporter permease [Candidatus Hydrogenedentota bacterium]
MSNIVSRQINSIKEWPSAALVRREMLRNIRSPRTFLYLAIYVGLCIVVAVEMWPEAPSFAQTASMAEKMIWGIAGALFACCLLLVPGLASRSIVLEKEQGTYDLLCLTLIRPYGLLVGKILNTVGLFIMFIIASLPMFAVAYFVVGMDWVQLTTIVATVTLTSVSCAAAGVVSSAYCRRSFPALLGSYSVAAFVVSAGGGAGLFAVVGVIGGLFGGVVSVLLLPVVAGYNLVFTALCCWAAAQFLRYPPVPFIAKERTNAASQSVIRTHKKSLFNFLLYPMRQGNEISYGKYPFLTKELQCSVVFRGGMLARLFYITLILNFLLSLACAFGHARELILVQTVGLVLLIPVLTANLLAKEYELGNIDMIRSTLLTPLEVISGKLYAGAAIIAPVLCGAILASTPLFFFGEQTWDLLVTGYVTLILCSFLSLGLVMFLSVVTKKTSVALGLSFLLEFLMFAGLTIMAEWIDEVFTSFELSAETTCFLSPIAAFSLNAVRLGGSGRLINSYWVPNATAFAMLAFAFLLAAVVLFGRQMQER